MINQPFLSFTIVCLAAWVAAPFCQADPASNSPPAPPLPDHPVSMVDAVNLAMDRNGTIVKARKDLEASAGVVIQTKAILAPKIQVKSGYQIQERSSLDAVPLPAPYTLNLPDQNWNVGIQLVQSIYEGGRLSSALRTARLTKEQAVAQYQTVLNDTLLTVRTAYYDVLLAEKQIAVEEAAVELLKRELRDASERFKAGTVPSFNVLRAKVELANEQPRLIKARNSLRIERNNLANLMGFHLPADAREDIPLLLSGKLEVAPFEADLAALIQEGLSHRPELTSLRKIEQLRREDIVGAQSGLRPSVQIFGGYADRNSQFDSDISHDLPGWQAGVQVSWYLFDGFLTRGKVAQARSLREKATEDVDDQARHVELEVRTAYSQFVEAKEVLDSQQKVVEEAEESLRLATSRNQAGSGTQLDVLSAQTALTQARTTEVQATHDYETAVAGVERAAGRVFTPRTKP